MYRIFLIFILAITMISAEEDFSTSVSAPYETLIRGEGQTYDFTVLAPINSPIQIDIRFPVEVNISSLSLPSQGNCGASTHNTIRCVYVSNGSEFTVSASIVSFQASFDLAASGILASNTATGKQRYAYLALTILPTDLSPRQFIPLATRDWAPMVTPSLYIPIASR